MSRKRVNIKDILQDPQKRRRLLAGSIRFLVSTQGRDLTWPEVYRILDDKKPWQMTLEEFAKTDPQRQVIDRVMSFDDWVKEKGIDSYSMASEHEEADYIGGMVFSRPNQTGKDRDKLRSLQRKVQRRHQLIRQYQMEVEEQKRTRPLNPQNAADRAMLRCLHKREIRCALRSGKIVPKHVTDQYPELERKQT